jgi:hypothetical protein
VEDVGGDVDRQPFRLALRGAPQTPSLVHADPVRQSRSDVHIGLHTPSDAEQTSGLSPYWKSRQQSESAEHPPPIVEQTPQRCPQNDLFPASFVAQQSSSLTQKPPPEAHLMEHESFPHEPGAGSLLVAALNVHPETAATMARVASADVIDAFMAPCLSGADFMPRTYVQANSVPNHIQGQKGRIVSGLGRRTLGS